MPTSTPTSQASFLFASLSGGAGFGLAEAAHALFTQRLDVGVAGIVGLVAVAVFSTAAWSGIVCGLLGLIPTVRKVGRHGAVAAGAAVAASTSLAIVWMSDPIGTTASLPLQGNPVAFVLFGVILPAMVVAGLGTLRAEAVYASLIVTGIAAALWHRDPVERGPYTDGTNLLLVTIDAARADRFGPDTPAFDRLARQGVRFDRALAQVPASLPSHLTLLSGQPPWKHGVLLEGRPVPDDVPLLSERLARGGWATGAFLTSWVLDGERGPQRGFMVYGDDFQLLRGFDTVLVGAAWRLWQIRRGRPVLSRPGEHAVDDALAWIDRQDGAWFAWVHLHDPHAPYTPPPPWDHRFYAGPADPSDPDWVQAQYDGEIGYVDAQLQRLLDALDANGDAGRTLVVVTGSHGERTDAEPGHGTLRLDDLHVPLAMRLPGKLPEGEVVTSPVELGDVANTVVDYLGITGRVGDGDSLRAAIEGQPTRSHARALTLDRTAPEGTWRSAALWSAEGGVIVHERSGVERFGTAPDPQGVRELLAPPAPEQPRLSPTERVLLDAAGHPE